MMPNELKKITLREALNLAYEGEGKFTLGSLSPNRIDFDFSRHRRRAVFWPLDNNEKSIRAFIRALLDGVVPVIQPARLPPGKEKALHDRYPRFGRFDGDSICLPDNPAFVDANIDLVMLTSGSTGEPKLVAGNLDNLTRGVRAIHESQRLDAASSTAILLPLAYSYALVNQLFWAMLYEKRLYLTDGIIDPAGTLEILRQHNVEMLCMVGRQIQRLVEMGFGPEHSLPFVKVLNFAGAPFPMKLYKNVLSLFPGANLYNNYGCTEAMPRLAARRVLSGDDSVTRVGKAIGDICFRVESGEAVGPIEFSGSSVSAGLLSADGSLTPHPRWIASGDMGEIINGELYVYGRHDQILTVGGERHSLLELESVLAREIFSRACIWLEKGYDDESNVLAVVEVDAIPEARVITQYLKRYLPKNIWPRKIYRCNSWHYTENGKTDLVRLKEQARAGQLELIWNLDL